MQRTGATDTHFPLGTPYLRPPLPAAGGAAITVGVHLLWRAFTSDLGEKLEELNKKLERLAKPNPPRREPTYLSPEEEAEIRERCRKQVEEEDAHRFRGDVYV